MDRDTRNAIERATQRARKLIEEDFAAQLEGDFDVHKSGAVAAKAGGHLSARQAFQRERIVAAIEHKRAAGMSAADAARDYLRDAAFTTINRFVALKMLEARDLVQECITEGEESAGYREFCGMAPGLPLLPDSSGYRLYIESIFDELSTEVKVLFDRRDPSSVLWPKRATFEQLLEILNTAELARVWGEDETIGWVYQFFNGQDERRKMREESPAPRNSRELAVRNQFFTPRYVVQFLTDNTLGRIWYEMRGTKTALAEKCKYMVRRPGEEFAPRAKKDPRELRVLDPACGSGHFLLYAFDLLLAIYEEAHADPESPKSEATGKTLAEDYPSPDALRKAVPGLVLAHNLHGVDIDPRCAQIAQLALWMRAQKAYRDFGIGRGERAQIRRSNIVVAEPLVADDQIAKEFVAKLGDTELGRVFTSLVESLSLAGDLGLLLRVELLVARKAKRGQTGDLFAPLEERIRAVLDRFVREEANATNTKRRLFAEDASHGIGLLAIAETRFDAVVMNPPFGTPSANGTAVAEDSYEGIKHDISTAFMARASELCPTGYCGAIVTRTPFYLAYLANWRAGAFVKPRREVLFADLGLGVLDALVETACICWSPTPPSIDKSNSTFVRLLGVDDKASALSDDVSSMREGNTSPRIFTRPIAAFNNIPRAPFIYNAPDAAFAVFERGEPLRNAPRELYVGAATQDDFRFTRLRWEVSSSRLDAWPSYSNGGRHHAVLIDVPVRIKWENDGRELKAFLTAYRAGKGFSAHWTAVLNSHEHYFRPGVTFSRRPHKVGTFWSLPERTVFGNTGLALLDNPSRLAFNLGVLNSSAFLSLLSFFMPRGTEGESTTLKYELGYVAAVPFPRASVASIEAVSSLVREFAGLLASVIRLDERSALWSDAVGTSRSVAELCASIRSLPQRLDTMRGAIAALQDRLDDTVGALYAETAGVEQASVRELSQELALTRREMIHDALEPLSADDAEKRIVSYLLGLIFDRWGREVSSLQPGLASWLFPEARCSARSPLKSDAQVRDVFCDDEGHPADVVSQIRAAAQDVEGVGILEPDALRRWLARDFFEWHLRAFSEARRKAPIYWQLATPSASYSVWLFTHAFSKDTLFRVQNDYVAPKLAHEERRLESLTSELRDGATAAQRKALAAQAAIVEELRAFLDEVKLVAPLWKPDLDDGVVINFAPLWRLVPQNKSWQKELKSTWDVLCEGKYDWAHLAMHLWPERVVPKCAKDRSLAIAHGLEDVFWVEGTDGKWTARKTPTRSVDELVRERTSPAVKSALRSLLEAPAAAGKSGGRRGGGRRKSAAAAEGGDA